MLQSAKRLSKKRSAPDIPDSSLGSKRKKTSDDENAQEDLEESLALPELVTDTSQLLHTVVHTNRAPLVLAFALMLLVYTMPEQPLSSRLSLAQAVVSVNSRSKAVSLGLESGKNAEEEGWGVGQPVVKVMGREIRVMKRWGYEWKQHSAPAEGPDRGSSTQESSVTVMADLDVGEEEQKPELDVQNPPLWGIDLEAVKKTNPPSQVRGAPATGIGSLSGLPIYTPQSARSYLLKSFDTPQADLSGADLAPTPEKKKQASAAAKRAEKEQNLGKLLGALDVVYRSWNNSLDVAELDRRAWSWYVKVRPEVKDGVAGWGGKGDVKLADILALAK